MTPGDYSLREQRGWYLYDWANSAYATTVLAVFLGSHLTSLAQAAADANGYVYPLGIPVYFKSFWDFILGISVGAQVLVLPVVGAIADFGRRKKQCLAVTAYLGAGATMLMFFLEGKSYLWGGLLLLISNLSFGASIVVYNSFLPEIAPLEQRDSVSSKGWALGYAGGAVLLVLNLLILLPRFGIAEELGERINLCSAGVWWAIFTIPTLLVLRDRGPARVLPPGQSATGTAFRQLGHTLREMRNYPQTMTFLIGYLLYNDAIQTVLAEAARFGKIELNMADSQLVLAVLGAQVIGIFGAMGFNRLAIAISAKRAVEVSLLIWIAILVYAYAAVDNAFQFFIMVLLSGIVIGGSQALSRSIFAQLVPKGKEAEYFGIYEVSDKGTSWLGPPFFGLVLQFTRTYRPAILSLVVFFIAGLAILYRVDVEKGERDVALV